MDRWYITSTTISNLSFTRSASRPPDATSLSTFLETSRRTTISYKEIHDFHNVKTVKMFKTCTHAGESSEWRLKLLFPRICTYGQRLESNIAYLMFCVTKVFVIMNVYSCKLHNYECVMISVELQQSTLNEMRIGEQQSTTSQILVKARNYPPISFSLSWNKYANQAFQIYIQFQS